MKLKVCNTRESQRKSENLKRSEKIIYVKEIAKIGLTNISKSK